MSSAEVDNRAAYVSFGLAYVLGHGATALSVGTGPVLDLPGRMPTTVLGTGLAVGLLYLGEGAARRNVLHYGLGSWLALISTAALFLGTPGLFWVLAIAGGGGYLIATFLERRRLATSDSSSPRAAVRTPLHAAAA
jgi:hypothetical protein